MIKYNMFYFNYRNVKASVSNPTVVSLYFNTYSSSIEVKLFRSFLCNPYDCHMWSKYKHYSHKRVVVAINNKYIILFSILRGGGSMSAI